MKIKKLTAFIFLMFALLFSFIAKAEICPTLGKIKIDCDEDFCVYYAKGWFFESDKLTKESLTQIKFISNHFSNNYFTKLERTNDRTSKDYCA